jgi:hypothetical protein
MTEQDRIAMGRMLQGGSPTPLPLPSDPSIGFNPANDQPPAHLGRYAVYVGEGANGTDKSALQTAKDMQAEAKGDKFDIWRSTGWYQGKDNKWRSEIDDSSASLHQSFNPTVESGRSKRSTLGTVLSHDKLFTAYPHLRDMPLQIINDTNAKYRGAYHPKEEAITLNSGHGGTGLKTLLHEVQHAVQFHEGFRYGSLKADHGDRLGEIEAYDTSARTDLTATQRRTWPPDSKANMEKSEWPHPAQLSPREDAIWRSRNGRTTPPLLRRDPTDAFPLYNSAPYRGDDFKGYKRGYLERYEPGSSDPNFLPYLDHGADNPRFDQYLTDGRQNPHWNPKTDLKGRPFGRLKSR